MQFLPLKMMRFCREQVTFLDFLETSSLENIECRYFIYGVWYIFEIYFVVDIFFFLEFISSFEFLSSNQRHFQTIVFSKKSTKRITLVSE